EFLPHLFERFTQADTSTTRRQGGIGLGLAIIKARVVRHGGTVRADSAGVGKGATFTVRIPVLVSHSTEEGGRSCVEGAPAPLPQLNGIRVLLAEDDNDGRQMLVLILEVAGATVEGVGSAREALSAFDVNLHPGVAQEPGRPLARRSFRAIEVLAPSNQLT